MPDILRLSAFTDDPDGGNPAGVVLDASGLDEAAMRAIAADVGYSETAFVTARDGAVLTVRYFAGGGANVEVPFCGHATIATAVAFAAAHGAGDLVLHTAAGDVAVSVAGTPAVATLTSVRTRVWGVLHDDLAEALGALGWEPTDLDPALPPRYADAGVGQLILAAATRARLADLEYDFDRLRALLEARDCVTLALVCRRGDSLVFDARNPFPTGGVVEDPATGAAAAAFGAYLRALGLVDPPARVTVHQGDDMGRPSVLLVDIPPGENAGVSVSGGAVPIPV